MTDSHPYVRTFVRLLGFLRPYRWSLAVSVVLAVGSQAAAVTIAFLTGDALESAVEAQSQDTLWTIALAVLLVGLARALFMAGRRLISGRQALGVEYDMRDAMYAKLLRLSFGFYDRHQTGQLMSRATVDLQSVRFFLGYGLIFFFQHVVTIVGVGDRALRRRMAPRSRGHGVHAGARLPGVPVQPGLPSGPSGRAAEARRRGHGGGGEHRRRPRRQVLRPGAERVGEVRGAGGAGLRALARREPPARALRADPVVPPAHGTGDGAPARRPHGGERRDRA